ncbi:unnamed protein product, partial [marine sediment metagenome]
TISSLAISRVTRVRASIRSTPMFFFVEIQP